MTPEICPNCGEPVPARATSCPGCGSDDSTGWSEESAFSAADIPEENDFNYDDFVKREFGDKTTRFIPYGISPWWWAASIFVVGVIIWVFVFL